MSGALARDQPAVDIATDLLYFKVQFDGSDPNPAGVNHCPVRSTVAMSGPILLLPSVGPLCHGAQRGHAVHAGAGLHTSIDIAMRALPAVHHGEG